MTEELKKKLLDFSNSREPFLTHNHMYTADIGDGSAAVVLPMCRDSLNRWGGAHGGILFALCDVAMGMAIMSLRQEVIVTVNAAIDYLSAAAADSTLTAVGKVDRLGGKLAFCSAEVTDENGKYSFKDLAPGDYVVTVDKASLATVCPECTAQTHAPSAT